MKIIELLQILGGFRMQRGRPDAGVLHMIAEWTEAVHEYRGEDVVAGWWGGRLALNIGGQLICLPVAVGADDARRPGRNALVVPVIFCWSGQAWGLWLLIGLLLGWTGGGS